MMQLSTLIVTKNRAQELEFTLKKLLEVLDLTQHEVLVFIDGCEDTRKLIAKYDWVKWSWNEKSVGASPARNLLYKKAEGNILIGLDDDAHPISENFVNKIENAFLQFPEVGIIAFQEVRGIFLNDEEILKNVDTKIDSYKTIDFIGCGFAIKKSVYDKTRGFPIWIDIYGEEPCLSIEVLDLGYEILYENEIIINHRIDKKQRLAQGRNYFRFEKQLKNSIYYYLVYYPNPLLKIAKLLIHNFRKYALTDKKCFLLFFKAIFIASKNFFSVLKFRKPVSNQTLKRMFFFKGLQY